jgi:VCBS repeat-containing protein
MAKVKATNDVAVDPANVGVSINAIANDSDSLRYPLTITALNLTGTKGTAKIDPVTGFIDYSPNGAFNYLSVGQSATDTLFYTVSDGHGGSSTAMVTITVNGVNLPPVAKPDTVTTSAYQYVNIVPLANDTDPNTADHLTVTAVNTAGTKGVVTINTAYNTITWQPYQAFAYLSAGETATDTFQYTISDGHGGTSTATDSVIVTGVNKAPVAAGIVASTGAYSPLAINALASVTDVNRDDTLTVTSLNLTGIRGSATIDPVTGYIDYTPNGAFNTLSVGQMATDTLRYTVSDNHGGSSTATVTVTVAGVNVPPVAKPDVVTTSAYQYVNITPLANDTDLNSADRLTVTSVNTIGTKGVVTINTAYNTITWQPYLAFAYLSAGETATDTFQYTVSDGHGGTSTATDTVVVTGVNKPPVAGAVAAGTGAYTMIAVNALASVTDVNLDDTLTITSLGLTGTKGSATIDPVTGYVDYSPNGAFNTLSAGQTATDTLRYTVSDNHGGGSTGTITITVSGVNVPPVAGSLATSTDAATPIALNALASDSDVNLADTLTIASLGLTGTKGSATIDPATGYVDYSPNGAFNALSAGQTATDTLHYTVADNHGGSSTGTITVTVSGVNVAPTAASIAVATTTSTPIVVNALASDSDPNLADTLTITSLDLTGTQGSATIDPASGAIDYSPNGAFNWLRIGQTATDTLHYTVSDNHGASSTGLLTVTVASADSPPVAGSVSAASNAYTGVAVNVLASASDPDAGDTLSVTALDLTGTLGTATIDTVTGAIDYSPNGAFDWLSVGQTATDTLHYTVSDNHGASSTGTLTVAVAGVNVPPSAGSLATATDAYTPIAINALADATDPNLADTLSIASLDLTGTIGSATIDPNTGAIDYNPNGAFDALGAGQTAMDTLHFTVTDNQGGSSVATLTIAVAGVNVPPVAGAETVSTDAYTGIAANVLASASDTNSTDTLSVASLDLTGTIGSATIDPNTGAIDYSPNGAFDWLSAGQTATDTLHYTVTDNHGGSSVGTLTVVVAGVNVAPVAGSPTASTNAYTPIAINVLASATDPNQGDTLTVAALNLTGTVGSAVIDPVTGAIDYSPNGAFNRLSAGETGTDTIAYTVTDNLGATSTGTLTVLVAGVNQPPQAYPDTAATFATQAVAVNVLANDTDMNQDDTLVVSSLALSSTLGTATIDPASGYVDYSPNGAFGYLSVGQTATDVLQYTVSDNHGGSSAGTLTIVISGVNAAPNAGTVSAATAANAAVAVNVLSSDSDPNLADTLSIVGIDLTGTRGLATIDPVTGAVDYSPNGAFSQLSAGETATDTLHYTVSDNHGATSIGTLTVKVAGVNVPPVAVGDSVTTYANQAATINVLANDTDGNKDDVLTVSSLNLAGTRGSVVIGANGNVVYTAQGADATLNFGQTTTDSFGYTVSDGHGGTSYATVTMKVTGPPPNVSDLLGSGYLSTQGGQFVNAAGQVVRIVGIGWGGGDTKSFAPNDLAGVNYQQTMQEMALAGFNTIRIPWSDALLHASPAAGAINYTLNPDLQGLNSIQVFQKIVTYAGQLGLKIIFDHHNDEGSGGQQKNGLWYDVGGASDGTDGAGNVGTVSQATFQSDWANFASLWAGNSTVIGFDLANEPQNGTWLGPSTTSIQTMATQVGDAIQAVDPGALIIVENGYSNYYPEGTLNGVGSAPVVLNTPNKVVYSIHEYPPGVSPKIFKGNPLEYIQQMNNDWGYLITNNIAPVWIGELGSNQSTAIDQLWAQTLMNYMNGYDAAYGGPSVGVGSQGVSGDYWAWTSFPSGRPDGILQPNLTDIRQEQYAIAQQLYPVQTTQVLQPVAVSNSIILDMQQDYYLGSAQFKVAVDGVQIGGLQTVNANATFASGVMQQFFLAGNFAAGTHQITITFTNDTSAGPGLDRNLDFPGVIFDGVTQGIVNNRLTSNGSATDTIQATGTVVTSTPADTLILQAADTGSGSSFVVYADGQQIGGTQTLTALSASGQTQTFALTAKLGGGSHVIDVHQLSGSSGGSTIKVSTIEYDGALQNTTPTNAPGTLDQNFTVTATSVLNAGAIDLGMDLAAAIIALPNQMAFLAAGTHAIETDATGFILKVAGGSATLTNFNPAADQIDLMSGIGGFVTPSQAAAAVVSDGSGGAMLTMGTTNLDFLGVAPSAFSAGTFLMN